MGKSILELFQKEKVENFTTISGVPVVTKGSTFAERYDIKNSKDIKLSSPYPFINIAMWALNGIRIKTGERKRETFLEEELIGLRTLRGIASPSLYGTDIIRLKTGTTQMLDTMKADRGYVTESPDDKKKKSLGLGKKLQETRDGFKKFLGLPQPLNPSAWRNETTNQKGAPLNYPFKNIPVYDTMESLYEIKADRAGSVLGKILQQGAGNFSDSGKQVLGAGLSKAKNEFKKFILGLPGVADDVKLSVKKDDIDLGAIRVKYAQGVDEYSGFRRNYSSLDENGAKANEKIDENGLKSRFIGLKNENPRFPYITSERKTEYLAKYFENPIGNINGNLADGLWTRVNPYTTNPTLIGDIFVGNRAILTNFGDEAQINEASINFEQTTLRYQGGPGNLGQTLVEIKDTVSGVNKFLDVNKLRPSYLKGKKKNDTTAYSKNWNSNNKIFNDVSGAYTTLPPQLGSLIEKKGLDSGFDIINQTGRLTADELIKLDYKGTPLENLDLIPLRFQKVNDYSAVYLRAVVTNYQESITPNWEASQFLGDPFKVYSYQSVERKISFDVQLYSTSQLELVTMWRKIDWLAHLAYPHNFTSVGVTPSIFYFTFGNLFIDRPAILTSLNFSLDDNTTLWEIGGMGGRVKKSNAYEPFDRNFLIGGKALSVKGTPIKYKSHLVKDEIRNNKYGYDVIENGIGNEDETSPPTDTNQIVYLSWGGNESDSVNMNKFKLPMSIKASLELTLLESENNTKKLYNYGEKITDGVQREFEEPKIQTQPEKEKKVEEAKKEEKSKEKAVIPPLLQKPLIAQDTTKDSTKNLREKAAELKAGKELTDSQKDKLRETILNNNKGKIKSEPFGDGRILSYPGGDL